MMKTLLITFLLLSFFLEGFSQTCPTPDPCTQNNVANQTFVNGDVICITTNGFNLGDMTANLSAGQTATLYIAAGITVSINSFNTTITTGSTLTIINKGTINYQTKNFDIEDGVTFNNCASGTFNGSNIEVKQGGMLNNLGVINITQVGGVNSFGELENKGYIYNSGIFNVVNEFENSGTICGPTFGCGRFVIGGVSENKGNFGVTAGGVNCGNLDICTNGAGGFTNQNGNLGAGVTNCSTCTVILPVELISFNAKIKENNITINWETTSETDNDYFLLQKSKNGLDFENIARIEGNGTSSTIQKYEFIDKEAHQGINYYRLNQVDYDGTNNLSKVIAQRYSSELNLELEVFPNPSTGDGFYLKVKNIRKSLQTRIFIYNSQGQIVFQNQIVFGEGKVKIINKLAQGAYFVELVSKEFNLKKRLMIK